MWYFLDTSQINITEIIIRTINSLFENLFSSIDNNIYNLLDDITFVNSNILKDNFFKRFTAQTFYKFMKFMGVDIIYNHADYRLSSKRVLDCLEDYKICSERSTKDIKFKDINTRLSWKILPRIRR